MRSKQHPTRLAVILLLMTLPLVGPSSAVEPCDTEDPDREPLSRLIGDVPDPPPASEMSEDEFWNSLLFIRVRGWRPLEAGIDPWPNTFGWIEEQTTPGSTLAIYRRPWFSGSVYCEDSRVGENDLIFETTDDDDGVFFTIRRKGNTTLRTDKGSYKIKLEEDELYGMDRLNLNSNWHNPSYLRSKLALELFAEAGVAAPRSTFAKYCMKDRYFGLYLLVEQVDEEFLDERFSDGTDKGNLYKAYWINEDVGPATLWYRDDQQYYLRAAPNPDGGTDWVCRDPAWEDPPRPALPKVCYARRNSLPDSGPGWECEHEDDGWIQCEFQRTYQLKTNDSEPFDFDTGDGRFEPDDPDDARLQSYDDLQRLIRVLKGRNLDGAPLDSERYLRQMEEVTNVRGFARYLAANVLLGAWDNYMATPANYYLYNSGPMDQIRALDARKDGLKDELDDLEEQLEDGNIGEEEFEEAEERIEAQIDALDDERDRLIVEQPYFHVIPWDYDHVMGSQFMNTDWARMDVFQPYDQYSASPWTNHPGPGQTRTPLTHNLLANRAFRDYYADVMACLLNHSFNPTVLGEKLQRQADRILPAVYMETAQGVGEPGGDPRFRDSGFSLRVEGERVMIDKGGIGDALGARRPHTGAKVSFFETVYNGMAGDPHPNGAFRDGQRIGYDAADPWGYRGILDYSKARYESAWRQLEATGRSRSDYSGRRCGGILTDADDGQPLPW